MKNIPKHFILGAAILASAGITQTVAADTASADTAAPASQDKTSPVSQAAVQQQSEQVSKAKEAVDKAKEQAAAAESKLETAQKDNADANAQNIAQAQAAVTEAEEKVAPAETANNQAQAALDAAKTAENTQATTAQDAQAKAAQAETETKAAQDAVAAAQKAVDEKLINEEVAKAKAELDKAQNHLTSYQEQLKTAEAEDAKRQAAIDQAQADIKAAQAEVNEKQAKVSSLDQVHNTFTLSPAYINAIKSNNINGTSKLSAEAQGTLATEAARLKSSNNYISSQKDAQRMVSINAIPSDILLEINYYAQDLINQIRQQAGTALVTLTQNSMDYAAALSKAAQEEKYTSLKKQPVTSGVSIPEAVVAKFGLNQFGYRPSITHELGSYPNLASQENVSVDYLKKTIYDTIKFQLFDLGDSIGERSTISAQKTVGHLDRQKKGAYMGVGFSNDGIINRIQFLLFPNNSSDIKDASKITAALINPNTDLKEADAARKDLAASQAKLDAAQRALTNAQNKREAAPLLREVVQTAKDQLAKQERAYETALENSKKTASEETKARLAALAHAQTSLKEKEAAQARAQQAAEAANAELAELKAATAAAQEKAAAAATALAEVKKAVQAAQDYVYRLQNAPALLKKAEADLNEAKADLASKEEAYQTESAKLEALKAALAALEAEDPAKLDVKGEQQVLKVRATGSKTGVKPAPIYQAPAAALPKTGSAQSPLALAGIGLLSALGLAFGKRRKAE
ncbi:hypothetical protein STRDD11_02637 [Streptococcus sp. DD11]|uniref:SEC10/PgrA surface exclusion domain-containing protein n=1 Tax=Streptococcus sp. DD11 TaxID=1777879 RepID=UPI0007979688|nr:SEC10/PgrA surface exclusion domain-containing protein [Streptococcus sp. DD11]KXT77387.1 hypothetical protein STRDD11_02637 [Streptococcus sp. DD11]